MTRKVLSIAVVAAAVLLPIASYGKSRIVLKSLDVKLPATGRMFPAGPGADAANNNCLACHSIDMVLNQPAMPKAAWEAEVAKMRNAFKAPVDAKDVPAIVDYLVSIKGK